MKIVTIVLDATTHVQQLIPDDCDFGALCTRARDQGYYFNGSDCYVPYEQIKTMFTLPAPEGAGSGMIQGMTKQ
jgi:hypothetical protein